MEQLTFDQLQAFGVASGAATNEQGVPLSFRYAGQLVTYDAAADGFLIAVHNLPEPPIDVPMGRSDVLIVAGRYLRVQPGA